MPEKMFRILEKPIKLTDEQLLELEETLMELILTKKVKEGKIVFTGTESSLLN